MAPLVIQLFVVILACGKAVLHDSKRLYNIPTPLIQSMGHTYSYSTYTSLL